MTTEAGRTLVADVEALEPPPRARSDSEREWVTWRKALVTLVRSGVALVEQESHAQGCEDCHD
jgi:hypothetical protein